MLNQIIEKERKVHASWFRLLLRTLMRSFSGDCPVSGAIDLEVTPDYIKRDLGLIDGREAPYDSKLTR